MRKLLSLSILCSLVLLYACRAKTGEKLEADYLSKAINEHHFGPNAEWVVLLPGLGCHGCIQEGEQFMKDYVNAGNTSFILTNIESLKILQQKTGVSIKDHSNIIVDSSNAIKIPTENVVYPCIIQLKNGKYAAHAFQSPRNSNAFNNLKLLLKNKSGKS